MDSSWFKKSITKVVLTKQEQEFDRASDGEFALLRPWNASSKLSATPPATHGVHTHVQQSCPAIFCGAACNKFLFSNENKLVAAWWPSSVNKVFPSSMETSAKKEAKKMRKMLPNFMKPEALQRYISIMDTVAQRHFADGWENKKEVEVFPYQELHLLACCMVVCEPGQLGRRVGQMGHRSSQNQVKLQFGFSGKSSPLRRSTPSSSNRIPLSYDFSMDSAKVFLACVHSKEKVTPPASSAPVSSPLFARPPTAVHRLLDHLPRSSLLRNSSIEEAAAMPLQEYVDKTRVR
ncbi:hypothetical protein FF1_046848 [Malus domestica]